MRFRIFLLIAGLSTLPSSACLADTRLEDEVEPDRHELTLQGIQVLGGAEVARVVDRLNPLQVGEVIDPHTLISLRKILEANDSFESVDLYTGRGDKPGAIILYVDAVLDRGFHLETGLGRQPMQGWYLNLIGVRYNNLFRRGDSVRLGFRSFLRKQGLYLNMEYPRIVGEIYDLLWDINLCNDLWVINQPHSYLTQAIHRSRIHMGVRRWTKSSVTTTVWFGFSVADPSRKLRSWDDELTGHVTGDLVPVPHGAERYLDLRLEMILNRRHPVRPWRSGYWLGLRLGGSDIISGSSFVGGELDIHRTVPILENSAIAFRARSVYSGGGTPYHLCSLVGGPGSLRGFPEAKLSGTRGATLLWQLNTELRFPVMGRDQPYPRIIKTVFADVGENWNKDGEHPGIAANVGFGINFRIPWIQVLNAEVAFPVTGDKSRESVVLLMSLGRSF